MKQNIEQNWGLGEPWADAWLLSCDDYFFHKAISWSCIQTLLLSKNACAIVVTGSEISNHLMLILQVRYSSNESVVQQERSNRIISSVLLSVRFDWRNFALAPATPLQSFLYHLPFDYEW